MIFQIVISGNTWLTWIALVRVRGGSLRVPVVLPHLNLSHIIFVIYLSSYINSVRMYLVGHKPLVDLSLITLLNAPIRLLRQNLAANISLLLRSK
jgi:hypothetical protein